MAVKSSKERQKDLEQKLTYEVDVFMGGRWKVYRSYIRDRQEAIDCAIDLGDHAHVWFNGDCIFDTHPGQPEPANTTTP